MEEWRDVPGFEGLYQVSNFGRVKSLNYNHTGREHIMSNQKARKYYQVPLWKNKKCKIFKVNRIEYEAFYGPIPPGMQVNHINEDTFDNRLENLNLMTPKENVNWGTGIERRAKQKEKHIVQYDMDGNFMREWSSQNEAVAFLGVSSAAHISECCHGKREYAHGYKWGFEREVV